MQNYCTRDSHGLYARRKSRNYKRQSAYKATPKIVDTRLILVPKAMLCLLLGLIYFLLKNVYLKLRKIFQLSKFMRYGLLIFLLLILFSFIAAAQEPRQNGGANGQEGSPQSITPLVVGQKMPEEFWTREHLFYHNGDTIRKSLAEYKGKVIIFDFWATWCGACFYTMPKMQSLQDDFGDNFQVILINPIAYDKDYEKLTKVYRDFQAKSGVSLPTVVLDEYFVSCFPHNGVPHYFWLNAKGHHIAASRNSFVDAAQVAKVLSGKF